MLFRSKKECPEVVYGRSLPWMPKDTKEEDLNRKQAEIYKYQLDKQKHFIHEAPIDANFWRDPVVRAALSSGARVVHGPERMWRLIANSGRRLASRKIRTNWLVSDPVLAARLFSVVDVEKTLEEDIEINLPRVAGRTPDVRILPRMMELVLRSARGSILRHGAISAVELSAAGPVADEPVLLDNPDSDQYWDDVNGGYLDPELTRQARKLEMDWVMKEKVYSYCKLDDAKGQKPITLRWWARTKATY